MSVHHEKYDPDTVHQMDYMGFCIFCRISRKELAEINREERAIRAYDRLAAVLEKLEAKL